MSLRSEFCAIVGDSNVLSGEDAAPYLIDWRKRYHGNALAVVRPGTTAEVAAVVSACARAGAPMVPQGGNTGLVGGATPDHAGRAVVVSTRRLDRMRIVDRDNDTMTVEAGCLLQHAQDEARRMDRLFPLSLAAQGSCTVGGNLATNAGGVQVLRYGNARELTLGIEVVLPDGRIWDGLRGLRKDNTGYDLKQLFIGAEGTLGIITAATLRLFSQPRAQMTAWAAVPSLACAVALLQRARRSAGPTLTAFEVMSATSLQTVARELPQHRLPLAVDEGWFALLEISDFESSDHAAQLLEKMLADAMNDAEVSDAVVAQSLAESAGLWRVREEIPTAQARSGGNIKHDISLPLSQLAAFVRETDAMLQSRYDWLEPVVFGHLGDGNLHYNMGAKIGTPLSQLFEQESQITALVNDAVHAYSGSISAEHGLGQMKHDRAAAYKSPVELALMVSIKRALDPANLMNPGKLIAPSLIEV